MNSPAILLVEDDPAHAELAVRALQEAPSRPALSVVETLDAAKRWLRTHQVDLIVSDLRLPDGSAIELLAGCVPLVIMTSQGDEQHAVAAIKGGAIDYIVKSPEMYRDLPLTIGRALRTARAESERQRAEASLRESEERFRQLADSIQEAFWLYDLREQRMVYVSPAWPRVYGQPAASALADASARFANIHPEDRARVQAMFAADGPSLTLEHEYRVIDRDSVRWIEERTFPFAGPDGKPWRIAGIGVDVTRRRELEATLRQSQKMEAIGQLAGGVAHDFNNMLTAILQAGEQLELISTTDEQRGLCALVVSAAERTADLTRKLLSFSRKGRLRTTPVDVHAVIADVVLLLGRTVDRRVKIAVELVAKAATVVGDASELQSALLNLGLNARDAMPDGGRLEFSSRTRELDEVACATMPFSLSPGPYLQVSVRDTGTGIAPQHVSRVFEPFFTTKAVGQGTGLGLSAVYGTAIEHHGAIMVSSEVGRGTVFDLYLPLAEGTAQALSVAPSALRGSGLILLVDDEPLVRATAEHLLRSLGYDVLVAKDGAEAVQRFREKHTRLAAVLCDAIMPELSGSDAIEQMRQLDPAVPLVICSGFRHDALVAPVTESAAFLAKPYHRDELATVLAQIARRL